MTAMNDVVVVVAVVMTALSRRGGGRGRAQVGTMGCEGMRIAQGWGRRDPGIGFKLESPWVLKAPLN